MATFSKEQMDQLKELFEVFEQQLGEQIKDIKQQLSTLERLIGDPLPPAMKNHVAQSSPPVCEEKYQYRL